MQPENLSPRDICNRILPSVDSVGEVTVLEKPFRLFKFISYRVN